MAKSRTLDRPKQKSEVSAPYAMVIDRPGGPELFRREEIAVPEPKKGEIVIRQTAIGLNFVDIYQRTGLYALPGGFPAILGGEAAGTVHSVGPGVAGLRPGQRVAYTITGGAYTTHRLIAADRVVRLPGSISDEIAAGAMLKGLTAQYLIHDSYKVKAGDTVLVHAAAGGVGQILGQWLKAKGVTAIGTAGGKEKCKLAKAAGYAHVIDYKSQDFVEQVRRLTGGQGVAAVYDSVGKDTYPGSLKVLRKFGTFVSFGQASGVIENFKLADLAAHGCLFATRPMLFPFIAEPEELQRRARQLFSVLRSGAVRISIGQRFALSEVAKAHEALQGRRTTGQTILIP